MPTANLKRGNVGAHLEKTSSGTVLSPARNSFSEMSEPYMRVATTQRTTSRAMETRESELKVVAEYYGKSTKAFEFRRRANLAKAREMAVKMENYKKNVEPPLTSSTTPRNPHSARNELRSLTTRVHTPKEKPSDKKSSPAKRAAGGGISNLSFRSKDNVPHIAESRPPRHKHVECQTSASDIINWQVLADAKVLQPSPGLWAAILKKREDDLRRSMLKEERFVPEYSKSEVNYQTNLKEFLETGTVRHYDREFENQSDEKLKPKRALRYKPLTQPEMDLKKRLPKIEEELLRAFKGRA